MKATSRHHDALRRPRVRTRGAKSDHTRYEDSRFHRLVPSSDPAVKAQFIYHLERHKQENAFCLRGQICTEENLPPPDRETFWSEGMQIPFGERNTPATFPTVTCFLKPLRGSIAKDKTEEAIETEAL